MGTLYTPPHTINLYSLAFWLFVCDLHFLTTSYSFSYYAHSLFLFYEIIILSSLLDLLDKFMVGGHILFFFHVIFISSWEKCTPFFSRFYFLSSEMDGIKVGVRLLFSTIRNMYILYISLDGVTTVFWDL